jgi:hypothetical protein
MNLVDSFYHSDVTFVDPLGTVHGRKALKKYYVNMYYGVRSVKFHFIDETAEKDTHTLEWKMILTTKGLNSGKPIVVNGASIIRFASGSTQAVYHRDYFDMGEFIYKNVPVLKTMIKYVNGRLKSDD